MSTDGCDHGLLLIYLKDTQQIATYRGGDSFLVLTDGDTRKIHELASKSTDGGEAVALQYLLQNYKDVAEPSVTRADSWMPIIGLIAALLIFLLILAILIALFLSRFCCCCYKNKKEVYQVNTIPTYKTIEPLYVAAPNERFPMHANDTIYSTPYSGSPLPYPPPPGASRPITPASTVRTTRVVPSGFNKQNLSDPPSPRTQRRRDRGEIAEKRSTRVLESPQSQPSPISPSDPPSTKALRRIDRGEYATKPLSTTSPNRIDSHSLTTDVKPVATLAKNSPEAQRRESSVAGESATYVLPPDGSIYSSSTLPHPHHRDAYLPPINEAYGTIPRPWISPPSRGRAKSLSTDSDLAERMECLSVSSTSDGTTTYSTTEEEVLSVVSESEFKSSNSQLDLLSQGEAADPFAPIVYAEKIHPRIEPANRTGMEVVKLVTNIFPIRTDPNREVYRYDVSADLVTGVETRNRNGGVISMNRGPKDDTLMTRRSEAVRAALKAALEAYRILSETGVTVFDGTTILFSNEDLAMALKPHNGTLTLPEKQREIRITIRPCTDSAHHFTIGDAEAKIANGESAEYKETTPDARLVAALVLDAKIGTFYKANGLVETIAQLNRWEGVHQVQWDPAAIKRTNTYLRGLQKARKPDDRWNLIKNHLDELDLSRNSPIMAGFGISVDSEAFAGYWLPSACSESSNMANRDPEKKLTPRALLWTSFTLHGMKTHEFYHKFKHLSSASRSKRTTKGITIRSLEVENAPTNLDDEVRTGNLFAKAKNQRKILGAKATIMIIYISNKFVDPAGRIPETRSHGLLKFLEAKHQIVTQHLATDTILGKKQYDNSIKPMDNATMENHSQQVQI
ncbi:unnamed protein product, partial [Mesorhabditis belari]|uniref:Uncharacterized protein n=1 Tax=Mesorhabditis belari TaxID=2138241 RepID=A0AAF3F7R4_9BILA